MNVLVVASFFLNSINSIQQRNWLIGQYRADYFRIDGLGKDTTTGCNIVDQFREGCPFNFFPLQVGNWVEEVESEATLAQLPDEELLLLTRRNICNINILMKTQQKPWKFFRLEWKRSAVSPMYAWISKCGCARAFTHTKIKRRKSGGAQILATDCTKNKTGPS